MHAGRGCICIGIGIGMGIPGGHVPWTGAPLAPASGTVLMHGADGICIGMAIYTAAGAPAHALAASGACAHAAHAC